MEPLLLVAILAAFRFSHGDENVNLTADEKNKITGLLELAYDSIDEALTKMFILSQKNEQLEKQFTSSIHELEARVKRLELNLKQVVQEEEEWLLVTENPKYPAVPTTSRPTTNKFASRPLVSTEATTSSTTKASTTRTYPTARPAAIKPKPLRPISTRNCPTDIGNKTTCFDRRDIGFSCYCFVGVDYSWPKAEVNCQVNNMHLVSVETEGEERLVNALSKLANHKLNSRNTWWWSSGSDQGPGDEWVWSATGQPILEGYFNWRPDQVDLLRDIRVLLVLETDKSVWDNWTKESDFHSICEI